MLHHGGFFVGQGSNRAYVDGKVSYFDHCEADSWSTLWLDDFLEQLNYLKSSTCKVYWLLPGKDLPDGLRIVSCDADTLVMMSVVHKFRQFVLYVDHDDHIAGLNWEDIVVNPIGSLPKVLSPRKVEFVEKKENVKLPDFYSNLDSIKDFEQCSGEGSDYEDQDFVDSDYDMEDDDDLFWDNVDEVVDEGIAKGKRIGKGKGLAVLEEEELSTNEDDLQAPDSDGEGHIRMAFKSFRAVDMQNPKFKVGMLFETVE